MVDVAEPTPPKGRTTIYKGVRFKSRLEADFAGFCDRNEIEWRYEPTCYAADRLGQHVQYLPDFELAEVRGEAEDLGIYDVLVEIKPLTFPFTKDEGRAELYPLLERMSVVWDTEPKRLLRLILWGYGDTWPRIVIWADGRDRVWQLRHDGIPGMKLLLPGMGQWSALADRHLDAIRRAGG